MASMRLPTACAILSVAIAETLMFTATAARRWMERVDGSPGRGHAPAQSAIRYREDSGRTMMVL